MFSIFQNSSLSKLLERGPVRGDLRDEVRWLGLLVQWMRNARLPPKFRGDSESIHSARLRYLIETIGRDDQGQAIVSGTLNSVLTETRGLELFCQTGLYEEFGLLAEFFGRILKRLLPTSPKWDDFSFTFPRIFNKISDSEWLSELNPSTVAQFVAVGHQTGAPGPSTVTTLRQSVVESLLILCMNYSSMSQSVEVRKRKTIVRVSDSPGFRLSLVIHKLSSNLSEGFERNEKTLKQCEELISECRKEISDIFAHIETMGVSVSLVYSLEHQLRLLRRIESLLILLLAENNERFYSTLTTFLGNLVVEHYQTQSVRSVINENLHLLSRKVVERTGFSGEHYITKTRKEYLSMLNSAAGGGFLTAATAYFKFAIAHLHAAPFFEGLLFGLNYSVSFVLIQFLGFTLATKQPSMTASTLAGKLKSINPKGLDEFVDEVAMITRSQFAAAVGNLFSVIPISICADLVYQMMTQTHIVDVEKATSVLQSFHPFESWTILGAAFTGVILWLSSICAGWFENWFVCRQVPLAIAQNPVLNSLFGIRFSNWISGWTSRQVSGFSGNVSLGFMLGFTPVFFSFFGIPLDVRHVTLSTAALTIAGCSLWPVGFDGGSLAMAILGIGIILILNFSVAFFLALFVAARARRIPGLSAWPIIRPILKGLSTSPRRFFFPPK